MAANYINRRQKFMEREEMSYDGDTWYYMGRIFEELKITLAFG